MLTSDTDIWSIKQIHIVSLCCTSTVHTPLFFHFRLLLAPATQYGRKPLPFSSMTLANRTLTFRHVSLLTDYRNLYSSAYGITALLLFQTVLKKWSHLSGFKTLTTNLHYAVLNGMTKCLFISLDQSTKVTKLSWYKSEDHKNKGFIWISHVSMLDSGQTIRG